VLDQQRIVGDQRRIDRDPRRKAALLARTLEAVGEGAAVGPSAPLCVPSAMV